GVIFHKAMLASGAAEEAGQGPGQLPRSFLDFAMQSNAMFPGHAAELFEEAGNAGEPAPSSPLFLMYPGDDEDVGCGLRRNCPRDPSLIEWLTPEEVARVEQALTHDLRGALRFRGDDQVNPYKTADALRAGAVHHGARLLAHTEVTGIEAERGRIVAVRTGTE